MREADYIRTNLLAKLGEESLGNEKYQDAINYINQFFELKNKNAFNDLNYLENPCYFNRGLAYFNLGNYQRAVADLSNFISKDTSSFDAYFLRTQAYFELDDMPKAIADIKSALSLKPSRGDLYINLGIAHLKQGDKLNAKPALQKAVQLGFQDAQTYIDNYC